MKNHLTEKSLGVALKTIFPNHEFVHDKVVPGSGLKNRADYRNDDLKLIIEFDGYRHYSCASVIYNDAFKEAVYSALGYKIVRIPYFVQLSKNIIKQLFNVDCDIEQTYPHGFIDDEAMLPCDYCELGVARFKNEIRNLNYREFDPAYADIISSLEQKIKQHLDISKVMPPSLYDLISVEYHYGK